LRDVAAELERLGYLNQRGKPFSAASINYYFVRSNQHFDVGWCYASLDGAEELVTILVTNSQRGWLKSK
jgi:hypothetical protein